ncbi:uncharacterized protein N7479_008651 [Penicillium vulpinum]|uniref:Uncharacterized protein n=1 Tax=Penicillium vulpinum TaxID=29845 RepID=A0A1V6S248_9EURO|nr:uncharacterized protein N7479_008651 [Penicillium vulpinum]KAJ5950238.1 hypothetical protein N7479_008651 [Penicillium vulpinum]OQE07819.1 hypothetical protein PENVUL_c012G05768 [Penicillium vulpinum]
MRLRSNHVIPPISDYIPRRRRQTRSVSAQPGTEAATETAPEVAQETVLEAQSAEQRQAPKRKPAKRAGRKKKAAPKGKKQTEAAEPQEDPVTLIPSVEQPDTRKLHPKPTRVPAPHRIFKGRNITAVFRFGSASELLQTDHKDPTPSLPQTPLKPYAWPPGVYNKLTRIPWSLPWSPPPPQKAWPHRRPLTFNIPDEPELTSTEEPSSRKRNRLPEDDPSPSKRHKLTLQTPPGFENRPRGSSRRTYADRARRREAERDGRIDRTIYRFPQLLAQQGEDARSGNDKPLAYHADEETMPHGDHIVPVSSLPSALPPNQNQNRPGWRQWIFNSVTGLWRRDNAPQTAEATQMAEPQHPMENEPPTPRLRIAESQPSNSRLTSPTMRPRFAGSQTPNSRLAATPRPRIAESQVSNPRLTASARAPLVERKKYSYDLDPPGFDPELLARMRARKANPQDLQPVTSPEQVRARYENESKKRKRAPSPDVIPHPPNCSFGFAPEYFIIDEDDDDLLTAEQEYQDTKAKQATVSDALEEEHVSKRVRSDTAHLEKAPEEEHVSKRVRSDTAHLEKAPEEEHVSKRVRSDNTHLANAPEEEHVSQRVHSGNTRLENFNHQAAQIEDSELRKARHNAEQYKPKTPSRLRAAHRFSSSCNESLEEDNIRRRKMRKTSLATACPTGDLNNIIWPETEPWVDRFNWGHRDLETMMRLSNASFGMSVEKRCDKFHQVFIRKLAARRGDS